MWANWEVVALAEWLRRHNDGRLKGEQVGFYGLDVYSLWESLNEITGYLSVRERAATEAGQDETSLDAVMNAEVVNDAEAYYRIMVRGGAA